jgi:hypothetical protein
LAWQNSVNLWASQKINKHLFRGQAIHLPEEQSVMWKSRMKNVKMQCIELHDDSENPIHCPFCGVKIAVGASEEDIDSWIVGHCDHLLFAAIDEVGFEYRSERFDDAVKAAMRKKTDEEREELEDDAYQLAELVEIHNALMFHSIMGSPAQENVYIGFAPIEAGT